MNSNDRLHQQLRAHVAGLTSPAAAVDLLIAHRTWLNRHDFLERFTFTGTDLDTQTTSTGIEWAEAINALRRNLASSGGEARSYPYILTTNDGYILIESDGQHHAVNNVLSLTRSGNQRLTVGCGQFEHDPVTHHRPPPLYRIRRGNCSAP